MGREVVNIRTSDMVVIVGGHSGTLGEFSIAYDEGKLIGVLLGSGGITTEIKQIVKAINKKTGALHVIDVSPVSERMFTTIPGSINVPLENLRREGVPFDKNEKCVLYSKTSSRAYEAYRYLVSRGYSNISFLEGGHVYWAQ